MLQSSLLTASEIRGSHPSVVLCARRECFPNELPTLEEESPEDARTLKHGHPRRLNTIMIWERLRVGGRLQWSGSSEEAKHLITLPNKYLVMKLIVRYYHNLGGHVGTDQVLAVTWRRILVFHGRSAVSRVVGRFLIC